MLSFISGGCWRDISGRNVREKELFPLTPECFSQLALQCMVACCDWHLSVRWISWIYSLVNISCEVKTSSGKEWDPKTWNREHLLGPRWNWPSWTSKSPWASLGSGSSLPSCVWGDWSSFAWKPCETLTWRDDLKSTAQVCASWWVGVFQICAFLHVLPRHRGR